MELLLRIIVRNISTEFFSGIFQEKTFKKIFGKWSTLYTCSTKRVKTDTERNTYTPQTRVNRRKYAKRGCQQRTT